MNVFTQSSLLVLLLMSSLPVMTSLPDFFGASPQTLDDLDSPEALESLDELRHQYAAYLHDQPGEALDENALNEVEDDAESYRSSGEVTKRTQRLRKVMGAIYRRIQAVEQQKKTLRKLEMLYQSGKRGPSNHFLRIGKRSADNIENMAVPETMSGSATFRDPLLFNTIYDENQFSPILSVKNRDVEYIDEHSENVRPSFPTSFSKRGFLSKSRFLRIGKSSPSPVADNLSSILFSRLRGEDQREDSMQSSQQTTGPVVRRSYVRIGRLPASVFRQQQDTDSQPGTDSFLAGRRSPGYRLSKSGVVRAGKRTI